MRKFLIFVITVLALILTPVWMFADSVSFKTIVPNNGRVVYWKGMGTPGNGVSILTPENPGNTPMYLRYEDFGVDIPVKTNDYVEVTFTGNIFGNGYVFLEPGTGSSAADRVFGSSLSVGWDRHPPIWRPYSMKYVFKATADGVLKIRQTFTRYEMRQDSTMIVKEMIAFAEIINEPVYSP